MTLHIYAVSQSAYDGGVVGFHLLNQTTGGGAAVVGAFARTHHRHSVLRVQVAPPYAVEQHRCVLASRLVQTLWVFLLGAEKGVHAITLHQGDLLLCQHQRSAAFDVGNDGMVVLEDFLQLGMRHGEEVLGLPADAEQLPDALASQAGNQCQCYVIRVQGKEVFGFVIDE